MNYKRVIGVKMDGVRLESNMRKSKSIKFNGYILETETSIPNNLRDYRERQYVSGTHKPRLNAVVEANHNGDYFRIQGLPLPFSPEFLHEQFGTSFRPNCVEITIKYKE